VYYIDVRYAVASAVALCAMAAGTGWFEDRSAPAGVTFTLRNSATPEKHQIETMPGGVAVLDYDGDGRPDLFFANGAAQPSLLKSDPSYFNRLYRNRGDGTFDDVTEKAGVRGEGFSIAAAAADFDNDGRPDLFVAGVNRNFLYRNRGDGTFEDVTGKAGVANQGRWAVSAGWFDYDNDGRLDLLVVNYVKWDPAKEPFCGDARAGYRSYCHPKFYEGLPNTLYRNNGDGTFTDVSERAGIARQIGKGMGLAFADYDGDGRLDVFVANDTVPNFLFHNERDGTFREVAFQAGVAMNDDGRALSSMGVDFRDVDNDGRPDLFVTALNNETFPLFRNLGKGLFADVTYPAKIGSATMALSGWSAGAYDFDNDGRKDLFAACGDVQDNTERYSDRRSKLPNLLLVDRGNGRYESLLIGEPAQHRGAAFADLDGDGRVDIVVTALGRAPLLLRNTAGAGNHWLGLRLTGTQSNRDAIGARVHIVTASGEQWNHVTTAVGYASSSEKAVHFGLGKETSVKSIEIAWPSGVVQRLANVAADRYLDVSEPQP
jgi:enediyne biosynthesis protein E4